MTRTEIRAYEALKEALIRCHDYSRDHGNTARETVDLLIDEVGMEDAKRIVAAMLVCKGRFDGRIDSRNHDWAEDELVFPEDVKLNLYYCDAIHPAHMDMIASNIRKR